MNLSADHAVVIYNSIKKAKRSTVSIQPIIYEILFLGLNPKNILLDSKQEVSAIIVDKEEALQYLSKRFNIQNKEKVCLPTL